MISKLLSLPLLLASVFSTAFPANAQALAVPEGECEFLWPAEGSFLYLPLDLRHAETWTLLHFLKNQPVLSPQRESGQMHQDPEYLKVEWQPLLAEASLPRLMKIGKVGVPVYEIYYSHSSKLLLQEREDWTFCPVWGTSVDENSLEGYPAKYSIHLGGQGVPVNGRLLCRNGSPSGELLLFLS